MNRLLFFLLASLALQLKAQLVNFDGLYAPTTFANQLLSPDAYSDGFVTFTGNWEVLDCLNGGFGVTGFSSPNGLKWNTGLTGLVESINFQSPVEQVSFKIGSRYIGSTVQVRAFDVANTMKPTF